MKKEKFTTRKKFKEVRQVFSEFGIKYITEWTEKQLQNYKNQPVIIPRGNYGFLLGTYEINGIHSACWRVKVQNEDNIIHDFQSKLAAIIYCYYLINNKLLPAYELAELDGKLGRLDLDILYFKNSLKNCKDTFKWNIINDRYYQSIRRKNQLSEILKKTLKSAKYLNFGNQII